MIGPYEMEQEWGLIGGNIFHGELCAEQLFHMRPAPGLRGLPDPDRRAVPVLERHARGRRRDCGIPAYNCVREIKRDRKRRTRLSEARKGRT